jgi:phospholipase C
VFIVYDDSDGWYDHVMGPVVNQSDANIDALTDSGRCGRTAKNGYAGRCGYGPRLPLLVISPWSKRNYVSHSISDQSSILRFIEDNWQLGRIGDHSFDEKAGTLGDLFDFTRSNPARLILDPSSGLAVKQVPLQSALRSGSGGS